MIVPCVDTGNGIAVFVFFELSRLVIEVKTLINGSADLTDTCFSLDIKADSRSRVCSRNIDTFKENKSLSTRCAACADTFNSYLFDELFVICFQCVKAVDHVVNAVRLVGSRITKCQYRLEFFQALLCLLPLNRLRFVYDKHGICLCNNVDRTTASELIELHIDTASVLALCVERLRIDYHDIDIAVTCKAVYFG